MKLVTVQVGLTGGKMDIDYGYCSNDTCGVMLDAPPPDVVRVDGKNFCKVCGEYEIKIKGLMETTVRLMEPSLEASLFVSMKSLMETTVRLMEPSLEGKKKNG